MISISNILGITLKDPTMPGRLYLSNEGTLTKDVKRAKRVEPNKLHKAIREIKVFSRNFFITEVANVEHSETLR